MCLAFNRFQFLPGGFEAAVGMPGESREQWLDLDALYLDAQQIRLNF